VRVSEVRGPAEFLVLPVVQQADEGLQQEEADDNGAERGVSRVEELRGVGC
jgi:hypothetical protein